MKVVKMADTNEMAALVQKGVALCAEAEGTAERAYRDILALQTIPEEAYRLGMIGKLECSHLTNGIREAAGDVAAALAKVFAFHRRGTEVAIKNGVDVPQPRDGGGGR